MDVEISEGKFVEVPTPDATGMDRRAFGEFVGMRGELASYALGWTTGADPHVGRITIGIGAGNPGGGTFHAVVFPHEGSHAFGLVDEPFESVPEGGRHLTADQARGHDDLPFIWWVADHVMGHDRRAWWMRHWLLGTYCNQTRQVWEREEPILYVSHDGDGTWQLIGSTGAGEDGHFGHLHHAIDEDPSLLPVLDLAPGSAATRTQAGGTWARS